MSLNAMEAGHQLAQYLRRVKMQQKELAAFLGIEASYISRMVHGHVNWTTGQYFGRIASKLQLNDEEIKLLNPAAVVESNVTKKNSDSSERILGTETIPAELIEAATMYSSIDPEISDPQVQIALACAVNYINGPRTPNDWIRYFNDVRNWVSK